LLIQQRDEAKKAKNYEQSDAIREEISAMGISLMDTAEGTLWEKL
jgi:cysteinyl-tRNA synthetase